MGNVGRERSWADTKLIVRFSSRKTRTITLKMRERERCVLRTGIYRDLIMITMMKKRRALKKILKIS
jgi:hypothetical protein